MTDDTNKTIKLHAFMAQHGIASRRKAEELIEQGKVVVNGKTAHIGQRINPTVDTVVFQGKKISQEEKLVYVLIYKPKGMISTTSDELNRKTVLSLVPEIKTRLYPVGRLDKDSEGLMLLTNDGDLTDKLTHPRYEVPKTYEVLVSGKPTDKALDHLRRGVKLKEGYTNPAEVEVLEFLDNASTWLSVTITEGRNHQVRRMLERVGYDTLQLIRVKLGPFEVEDLGGKTVKKLTQDELEKIISI